MKTIIAAAFTGIVICGLILSVTTYIYVMSIVEDRPKVEARLDRTARDAISKIQCSGTHTMQVTVPGASITCGAMKGF